MTTTVAFLNEDLQRTPVSQDTPLPVGGVGYSSTVSFNRTANTTTYDALDVLGPSVSPGLAVLEFEGIGPAGGGEVVLTFVSLEIDRSDVPSGMTTYRLAFYSDTPDSNLGDGGAWSLTSGDRTTWLGFLDIGIPVDMGATLYVEVSGLARQITVPEGGELKAYLITTTGYSPASETAHKVVLKAAGF